MGEKIDQEVFHHIDRNLAELGHGERNFLDFVVFELFPDTLAVLVAQRQHQDGGAFHAGKTGLNI